MTQVAAIVVTRQPQPPLDWFATISTVLIVVMFLWPPQFHYHFAAFLAPFLALTLALPVSRLLGGARRTAAWPSPGRARPGRRRPARLAWPSPPWRRWRSWWWRRFQFRFESAIPRVIGPIPATIDRAGAARRLRADRPGVGHAGRQQVRLHRPELPADGGQPRHHAGAVGRPEAADGSGERAGGERVRGTRRSATPSTSSSPPPTPGGSRGARQLEAYFASHFTQLYESPRRLILYVRKDLRAG